ncbi:collagen binding domain-containing protein [Lactiplantibacillus plantarum]|uniref:collagen binding domain-containing protein n=1 Tax=Lactiplantibacillus plantarum TaxID=1590 RepID=UPI00062DA099|nr:collagen binding domain-containing protein [Lactiplantibacillus plantarum]KLD42180.1 cell surface protein [Lactiplantibacillus plantarum]MCG3567779.1 Ig-like domain-containing protein [Lactiplantibacillus plantarum]MCG3570792.1 Ig-like domain-containing protein [Lactiplantibacillus plantarum]MCK6239586.1 Ig-like domain-containing protein [Lactiplantibacillus plantarum]MEE4646610.1 collagen binding domain-containing protein [Lactiplantibacillus plantarum]
MKLSKRGLFWLLGLVSFAILLLFSQPLGAQAATNYHAKDYTTAASVINGPDFKHADTIQIQYQMSFGDTAFKAGDTVTIDMPANLEPRTVGATFDVTDAVTGTVIGTGVVGGDGQVVLTMNSAIEGKTNVKIDVNLGMKYRYDDLGEQDVVFDTQDGQDTSVINMVANEANMSKKGTIDKENGTIKWTLLVDRREITMKNLSIADTIGDHQQMIKGIEVYNGEWSSANTYKRRDKLSDDAYQVNYSDNGFDLKFNDTVSNLVVIDYYTKITDTELIDQNYHFKNKAVMEWGGGTSGGKNSEEANGKVYEKVVNGESGTGDLSSSSSSNSSSSNNSSDVDSSSDHSSSESSSAVDSSSDDSSSNNSSDVDSSSDHSSSESSSAVDSSSDHSSSESSSAVDSSSDHSSSESSSAVDSSSDHSSSESSSAVDSSSDHSSSESSSAVDSSSDHSGSESSSDVNTSSESSDNTTTEPDNGHQTGDIEDPEDNTAVYPDIDEDTGTIDVDGGFDSNYDGSTTSNSTNSSKPLKDSTSSVFTSTPANTTTGQDGADQTPAADTKKSSAKTTVSESDALTPSTPNQVAKLPQTNEAKMDSQALRSVGILLGVLTLGAGALIRHWF